LGKRRAFSLRAAPAPASENQTYSPPIEICIFLLTMQHQYLNILCVSIQRYNSLGFKKVRSVPRQLNLLEGGSQLMATKKKAAKKKKKK
jgi:hypothetical protein